VTWSHFVTWYGLGMELTAGPGDPYGPGTAARDAIERLANRWTVLITYALEDGPTRFNDLKNRLGVSSQVLARVLRDLERDGLINRRVFAEVPARVEYSLTTLGGTMCSPVHAIRTWAETVASDIAAARSAFDSRQTTDDDILELPAITTHRTAATVR
jgi:DNA-binding HxlR family transcriptional regulator